MFNVIITLLLKLALYPITFIFDLFIMPFNAMLRNFSSDFSSYSTEINYFINNVIIRGIGFAREIFLNVTHFPRPIFYTLVTLFSLRVGLHAFIIFVRWAINVYYIIRGSHVKGKAGVK